MDFTLTPEEINQYEQRKNAARQNYGLSQARNTYERGMLDQNFAANQSAYGLKMDRFRQRLPGRHIQRGVFNSGIYHGALQDYAADRTRGFDDLSRQYQQSAGELTLRGQEGEMALQQSLQQIEAEQAARRANLAAALRSIM